MSAAAKRPLSPHLQIYKPQLTSFTSISHRASGVFLSLGSLLLAVWLYALAFDSSLYITITDAVQSTVGWLALLAWSAAFYYHLLNGVRHLVWDAGYGFELKNAYRSGYAVLVGAAVLTAITWLYVCYGSVL